MKKDRKCYSKSYRVVINHLPQYLTQNDIKSVLKNYGPFKISEFKREANSLSGNGRCLIDLSNFGKYEALIQRRYFQRKTLKGKDVFFEVEPIKTEEDERVDGIHKKIEIVQNGLAKRTLFVSGMNRKTTRKQFIETLKLAELFDSIELFIFKVDKEGKAIGDARIILKSEELSSSIMKKFPKQINSQEITLEYFPDADPYFELKLGKEMEMEKRKIQRKYKKLFKFPKTPQVESITSMLQEFNLKNAPKQDQSRKSGSTTSTTNSKTSKDVHKNNYRFNTVSMKILEKPKSTIADLKLFRKLSENYDTCTSHFISQFFQNYVHEKRAQSKVVKQTPSVYKYF